MLNTNEIYNMDCMEGLKLLDNKSIDLVVIDPPYLLNLTKVKKTTTFNNYANELIGFEYPVTDTPHFYFFKVHTAICAGA